MTTDEYTVEMNADAWRQLGQVPTEAYERIQRELRNRAELAGLEPHTGTTLPRLRAVNHLLLVDRFEVAYRIDHARRVVQVVSVNPRA